MKWHLRNKAEWHRWFAWHPVKINNALVWLRWVERRQAAIGEFGDEWERRQIVANAPR